MLGEFKPRGTDWFDSSPNGELCKMLTLKHEILNSLTSFDRNPRRILAYSCIFSCSDCRFRHSDSSASSQSRSLISSCPWCKLVQYLEEKMEMFEVWHNLHICHSKIHLHICVWVRTNIALSSKIICLWEKWFPIAQIRNGFCSTNFASSFISLSLV